MFTCGLPRIQEFILTDVIVMIFVQFIKPQSCTDTITDSMESKFSDGSDDTWLNLNNVISGEKRMSLILLKDDLEEF